MTKVLSLVLALMFVGVITGAAEAGQCDPHYGRSGVTLYTFCTPRRPEIRFHFGTSRGHHGHRHHTYRPRHRAMPTMHVPQCRPCIEGFARVPLPGKPCWCEPIQ